MSSLSRNALDRAALERVLARAAELQSSETGEPGHALTDDQILELGKEVGLTPDVLRRAIAEERGTVVVPEASGIAGSWFGAASISAARVIPGQVATVLESLDTVMRNELPFQISRRFSDRMQWTPKRGFLDMMRSQLARPAEGIDLRLSDEVAAAVVPIDGQRVHVRLDASLSKARRDAVRMSAVGTTLFGIVAFGVSITGAGLVFAIPIFGAGASASAIMPRGDYRRTAKRVGVALEQMLDRLEFGPAQRKGGLVDKLLG